MRLIDRIRSLQATWAALASLVLVLPGATFFWRDGLARGSEIAPLYATFATLLSALTVLVCLLLARDSITSRWSAFAITLSMILAVGGISGSIYLRNEIVPVSYASYVLEDGKRTGIWFGCEGGLTIDLVAPRSGQALPTELQMAEWHGCACANPRSLRTCTEIPAAYISKTGVAPSEWLALFLGALGFAGITAVFTILSLRLTQNPGLPTPMKPDAKQNQEE